MSFLKKIPLPFAGVFHGFGALGNLLQSYSEPVRTVCGVIGWVLLILYVIKLLVCFGQFREDMKNPIMASASTPFPMAIMLLSTYLKPLIGAGAKIIWFIGLILCVVWLVYFIFAFVIRSFSLKKVF